MKIVINEGQFESIISESKSHISQLCSHFNDKSKFCESVESVLKGRKKSIFNKSKFASRKYAEQYCPFKNYCWKI